MLIGIAILLAAVLAVFVLLSGRSVGGLNGIRASGQFERAAPASVRLPAVTTQDIPRVFASLSSQRKDGNFAVFLFGADGQAPAPVDALNIQFSIEGARAGIDWVLLAPANLNTQARFVSFFERKGRTVMRLEMDAVRYLRVEGDDLPELLDEFLRAAFGVTSEQKMDLIAEGFSW
jgi:hypothetical protein